MSRLGAELLRYVLDFLEEPEVIHLKRTGDRGLLKVLETRRSAVLPSVCFSSNSWPSHLPGFDSLIHLEAYPIYDNQLSNLKLTWPPQLVVLRLHLSARNSPFVTVDPDTIPSKFEALKLVFPYLRELRCVLFDMGGYWVFPPGLTRLQFTGGSLRHTPLHWLPQLLMLDESQINFEGFYTEQMPTSLESLSGRWHMGIGLDARLVELQRFKALKYLCLYSNILSVPLNHSKGISCLGKLETLTLHGAIIPLEATAAEFRNWFPPRLTQLHLAKPVPPAFYEILPRTLTKVTYCHRIGDTVNIKWDLKQSNARALPPALKYISLVNNIGGNALKDFDQHFSGLTSLDMRWTPVNVSEYQHLPPTLKILHLHAITLPKARLLSELFPKLSELGLHGGILTKAIAKCLPRNLQSLTLSHIGLVTKGHYHPSGDPKQPIRYSATFNPQLSALAHLPPKLFSFALFPSVAHLYWASRLESVLDSLPFAPTLLTLILDYGTRLCSKPTQVQWTDPSKLEKPTTFTRFERLQHLFISCHTLMPSFGAILHALPSRLVALGLPISVWYDESDSMTTIGPASHPSFPSSIEFVNGGSHEPRRADYRAYIGRHISPPISARSLDRLEQNRD